MGEGEGITGGKGEGSSGIKDPWIKPKVGRIKGGRGRGKWWGENGDSFT